MKKQELEKKAELIALSNYLSDYPDDWSFDKIINLLLKGDSEKLRESILVWETFEHYSPLDVARYIEDLKSSVMWRFSSEVYHE
jgi:hypothetical protein